MNPPIEKFGFNNWIDIKKITNVNETSNSVDKAIIFR